MSKPVTGLHVFAGDAGPEPLALLDAVNTTVAAAINDLASYSNYFVDTGAANAYVVTLPAGLTAALVPGLPIQFKAANANTGNSSLNVNSLGAKTILNGNGAILVSGEIQAGAIISVIYDGTNFQMTGTGIIASMQIRYDQTPAELATTLAPVFTFNSPYPYNLGRIIIPNSPGAAAANTAILKTLWDPTKTGPTGDFFFPNTTGADIYYLSGVIPIRRGVSIEGNWVTINFTGTGTSNDNNSGCFFSLGQFKCNHINWVVNWATGPSTSSGNIICVGARGTDSSYFTVYDSLLAVPMGDVEIIGHRVNSTITGAGLSSAAVIQLVGGLSGVKIDDISWNANGILTQGITYEFGWATNEAVTSARQTSHMHDFLITNIEASNMNNASSTSAAVLLTGAYNGKVSNVHGSGVSNMVVCNPGEAMFFRPWVGVDDVSGKKIVLENIQGQGFSNAGVLIDGTVTRAVNSTYLQSAWTINTVYVVKQTVMNGGNMYVCTVGGTSAGAGGPAGTGTNIVDNTVRWDYVPLTANTDLIDFSLDGFELKGGVNATGIYSSAGYANIRNGTITGCANPVLLTEECTRFDLQGVTGTGGQQAGLFAAFTASQIWPTARLKKGTIDTCYFGGNSASSAGTYAGMQFKNCDGVKITGGRIGFNTIYNGVAETTQGNGIQLDTNCSNVIAEGVYVGGVTGGGNFAYFNINNTPPSLGNTVRNPSGVVTLSGLWDEQVMNTTLTLGAAVAGNLAVTYTLQGFKYVKTGNRIDYSFNIQTSSFTYTTASGVAVISGLPYAVANFTDTAALTFSGLTKAGFTQFTHHPVASSSNGQFYACGTGVGLANVNITDFPTGGTVILQASGHYFTV